MHRSSAVLIASIVLAAPSAHAQTQAIASTSPSPGAKKTANTLSVVGALLLGAGYVPSLVVGMISIGDNITHFQILCSDDGNGFGGPCRHDDAALLIFPIVGPILYADPSARDHVFRPNGAPHTAEKALLITDETLQLSGLSLLLASLFYRAATTPDAPLPTAPSHAAVWSVTPECAPGRVGLGATYRF